MKILTRRQAAEKIGGGLSVRTLDRLAKDPASGIKFVQISERRVGVVEATIDAYLKRNVRSSASV